MHFALETAVDYLWLITFILWSFGLFFWGKSRGYDECKSEYRDKDYARYRAKIENSKKKYRR